MDKLTPTQQSLKGTKMLTKKQRETSILVDLYDFSIGDTGVTLPGKKEVILGAREAEKLVLSFPDQTPITLRRLYEKPKRLHHTTVSALRAENDGKGNYGWWGW